MTSLKKAFEKVRELGNIDILLPVFLESELYVIVAETGPDEFSYFYTGSPQPDRFCVTVAEDELTLSKVKWPKLKTSGKELLQKLPEGVEIIITYSDGGDYITREHLEWYRQQML